MELSQIILGQIVTEKSERQKNALKTYTLKVNPQATKIDVKNALKKFYDIDAVSVRVMRVGPKSRAYGRGNTMEKRHRFKKALVTISAKSKALDIANFKV